LPFPLHNPQTAIHNANEEVVRDLSVYLLPNGVWVRLHKDLLCYGPGYLILDIMDIAKLISLRSVAAVAAFDFVFVGKSASDEQREVGDINPGLGHQMESSRAL